jgi:predicted ferric reductase
MAKAGQAAPVAGRRGYGALVGSGLVVGYALLWFFYRPVSGLDISYLGEVLGVEAVVFMAWSLAMVTVLPGMESAYGGLDRQLAWHRRSAVAGTVVMVLHSQLTRGGVRSGVGGALANVGFYGLAALVVWALVGPTTRAGRWRGPVGWLARVPYDRWLPVHRVTGILLVAAMVHGFLQDASLDRSQVLKISYLGICVLGVVTFLYRELLMRHLLPAFAHTVAQVERPDDRLLLVTLQPRGEPLQVAPGQYVYIHFGTEGWRPHPFTVAGTDDAGRLQLAIQASGNETAALFEKLSAGAPARVLGPHGRFDYRSGGRRQVWIAAGVGITPFHSWTQSLDSSGDREVDFFYTFPEAERALFLENISTAAQRHPSLHLHLVVTGRDGRLTPEQVAEALPGRHDDVWVYMCGPLAMMRSFEKRLQQLGFPKRHIIWERFEVR